VDFGLPQRKPQFEPPRDCPRLFGFKLCSHGRLFQHGVVALLGFGRRYVADGLQEPSVVEPIDPFEGGELDGLEVSPWSAPVDHFGLVETVDGCQSAFKFGSDSLLMQFWECLAH